MKKHKSKGFISVENITREVFKNTYCCWCDGEIQVFTLEEMFIEYQEVEGKLYA